MIKKNIQCKDCKEFSTLFVKIEDSILCPKCNSSSIKNIYKPVKLQSNEVVELDVGDLSKEYLEENKFVLEEMKKEKMKWNS